MFKPLIVATLALVLAVGAAPERAKADTGDVVGGIIAGIFIGSAIRSVARDRYYVRKGYHRPHRHYYGHSHRPYYGKKRSRGYYGRGYYRDPYYDRDARFHRDHFEDRRALRRERELRRELRDERRDRREARRDRFEDDVRAARPRSRDVDQQLEARRRYIENRRAEIRRLRN